MPALQTHSRLWNGIEKLLTSRETAFKIHTTKVDAPPPFYYLFPELFQLQNTLSEGKFFLWSSSSFNKLPLFLALAWMESTCQQSLSFACSILLSKEKDKRRLCSQGVNYYVRWSQFRIPPRLKGLSLFVYTKLRIFLWFHELTYLFDDLLKSLHDT